MNSTTKIVSALVALSIPALVFAQPMIGERLGATEDEVRASLISAGYEVCEIEMEDDEIEAEVLLDGAEYEIEIDPSTGQIVEIELEMEDEDDDEDNSEGC